MTKYTVNIYVYNIQLLNVSVCRACVDTMLTYICKYSVTCLGRSRSFTM